MKLTGWGRYPGIDAEQIDPVSSQALRDYIQSHQEQCIARGCGRSYGDAALSSTVISSRHLDHFLDFDADSGEIHCAAGVTLDAILRVSMARGFILPVLPGTRFVSVGGAIAADVHGKNHHRDGCFSEHLQSFNLLLASGEVRFCSRQQNPELFAATCGGMGLTGIILDARLSLKKVPGVFIRNRLIRTSNLEETFAKLEDNADSHYSVAWVDCLQKGRQLGRGVIYLGEHADIALDKKGYRHQAGQRLSVPFSTPGFLLNSFTMRSFNKLYYWRQGQRRAESLQHYLQYFFPLDSIGQWNRLYGGRGFQQYQLVLPADSARSGMTEILNRVAAAGKGSFLAVLKQFGQANDNPLSFPMDGFTLTLDFRMEPTLLPLLNSLDAIVVDHGGRLYLAKDARMSAEVFRAGYPGLDKFLALRREVDPDGRFSSLLSQRLELDNPLSDPGATA